MAVTAEMLIELIKDSEDARRAVEDQLTEAEHTVRALGMRLLEIREEEKSFRSALARRFPTIDAAAPAEDDQPARIQLESWTNMSRTLAVEKAIAEMNIVTETVSPEEIESCLMRHGRHDDRDQIGGATAYLNRHNRIHSLGRGRWVSGPRLLVTANDFGPAPDEAEPEDANSDDDVPF